MIKADFHFDLEGSVIKLAHAVYICIYIYIYIYVSKRIYLFLYQLPIMTILKGVLPSCSF